jgi:hypothetical protein
VRRARSATILAGAPTSSCCGILPFAASLHCAPASPAVPARRPALPALAGSRTRRLAVLGRPGRPSAAAPRTPAADSLAALRTVRRLLRSRCAARGRGRTKCRRSSHSSECRKWWRLGTSASGYGSKLVTVTARGEDRRARPRACMPTPARGAPARRTTKWTRTIHRLRARRRRHIWLHVGRPWCVDLRGLRLLHSWIFLLAAHPSSSRLGWRTGRTTRKEGVQDTSLYVELPICDQKPL